MLVNGTIEFQLRIGDANRHSLRIHTAENARSFRIVVSRNQLDVARNPNRGESADAAKPLARERIRYKTDQWQTVRLTFAGEELKVQFAGITLLAKDPVFAELKETMHFIAFGGEVGLRRLIVVK
jgi:hypothetical protein